MTVELTFQRRECTLWYAFRVQSDAFAAFATNGRGLAIRMDARAHGLPGQWTLANRATERASEQAKVQEYRTQGDGRIWPVPPGAMPEILRPAYEWRTRNPDVVQRFIVPYVNSLQ